MRTLVNGQVARYRKIISPDLNHLVSGFVLVNRSSSHLAAIIPKLKLMS
jgi:hypothetical protein